MELFGNIETTLSSVIYQCRSSVTTHSINTKFKLNTNNVMNIAICQNNVLPMFAFCFNNSKRQTTISNRHNIYYMDYHCYYINLLYNIIIKFCRNLLHRCSSGECRNYSTPNTTDFSIFDKAN